MKENNAVFNLLYVRYKDVVLKLCESYAQSVWPDPVAEAEDMSQEVWLKIWRSLEEGYVVESRTFIEVIASQVCIDYNRVHSDGGALHHTPVRPGDDQTEQYGDIVEAVQDWDRDLSDPEAIVMAEERLAGLNPELTWTERKVLQYLYIDGHEMPKVAKLLKTTVDVVKVMAQRVRQKAAALDLGIRAEPRRKHTEPDYGCISVYSEEYGNSCAIARQVPNESVFPFAEEVYI